MIKRLLLGLLGLVIVAAVGSLFLPDRAHVEREVTIAAPPAAVFPHVNNPKKTEDWSPWLEHDRTAVLTYDGPPEGVGAKLTWRSEHPEVGAGTLEIVESIPHERVQVALTFEGNGGGMSFYELTPVSDGTRVVWGFDTEFGLNPVMRYMGLMFDRWIGQDYERGLSNLKELVERQNR